MIATVVLRTLTTFWWQILAMLWIARQFIVWVNPFLWAVYLDSHMPGTRR